MAVSPAQKKTVEDIVRRIAKDPKFRERVRQNLNRVLMDEYGLSGQTEQIKKLLPPEILSKELSDKELQGIAGGFSLDGMVSGAWHDVENAGKDVLHGAEDAGKAGFDAVKDVGEGVFDAGKAFVTGGTTVAKDLFTGKIGDAAKALVNVPVAASKAAVKGVVGGAEALGTGVVNVAGDTAKFAVDSSGVGLLGGALGITPKVDGLIDGMTSGLDKSVTGVGKLAQDVADTSIDFTNLPTTALAQSFDDVTHGKWGKALTDPVTVPLSTMGADGKQIFSDAANPNTIMGLLTAAGIAATPFTGGLSDAAAVAADTVLDGAGTVASAVSDAAGGAANAARAAATSVTQGASDAATAVRTAAESASSTVSKAASSATSAVRAAAMAPGETATSALNAVKNAATSVSQAASNATTAARNILGGAEQVETAASQTGRLTADVGDSLDGVSNLFKEQEAAQPSRLSQLKDTILSKKGLLLGGGSAAAVALVLPKILSGTKGAEGTEATGTGATGYPTQAAGTQGQAPSGLSTLQATFSDPKFGQLAQAIDQQAGSKSTSQNLSQLAQNTNAVMQNPTPSNVEQLSTQIAQVYQSLQSVQGSASQQMQGILSQFYDALNPPTT